MNTVRIIGLLLILLLIVMAERGQEQVKASRAQVAWQRRQNLEPLRKAIEYAQMSPVSAAQYDDIRLHAWWYGSLSDKLMQLAHQQPQRPGASAAIEMMGRVYQSVTYAAIATPFDKAAWQAAVNAYAPAKEHLRVTLGRLE